MIELIATQAQRYGQRRLDVGDRFTASEREAAILLALGRAEFANPVRTKRRYRRRDLQAEG